MDTGQAPIRIAIGLVAWLSITTQCTTPEFLQHATPWADQVIKNMSLEDKIAQLFNIYIPLTSTDKEIAAHAQFIEQYHIGSIYLADLTQKALVTVERHHDIISRLQQTSPIPLLVCEDLKTGLPTRLATGTRWPRAMTLGALTDDKLVYQTASHISREARANNIHMTATPVVDVNSNPNNPIIGFRAFGDTIENVSKKGVAFMQGLHAGGTLACAKHFPGHGDTYQDSHVELPLITRSRAELEEIELQPFTAMIEVGVPIVMIAHLSVPALDNTGTPATLSHPIITDLLKHKMHFQGIVMTDALNMNGISQAPAAEINLKALLAGNDILIFASKIPESIQMIKKAIAEGKISEAEITQRAHKIIKAKEFLGLHHTINSLAAIDYKKHSQTNQHVYNAAITKLHDIDTIIPLTQERAGRCAIIYNEDALAFFENELIIPSDSFDNVCQKSARIMTTLQGYDTVIIALTTTARGAYDKNIVPMINQLDTWGKQCIIVLFGNPYTLRDLPEIPTIVAYEPYEEAQRAAADLLNGKLKARGKLPVTFK